MMQIQTERLIVRDFIESDSFDAYQYLKDDRVMKWIEPAFTQKEAEEFVRIYGCEKKMVYSLIEKKSEKLIGHIIFHPYDAMDEYEIGWILEYEAWGKGYAVEISKKLIEYAFSELKVRRLIAETVRDNQKCLNVIRKLGMRENEERSAAYLKLYEINYNEE